MTPDTHWIEHAMALAYRMAEARLELGHSHCADRASEWAYRVRELREHLKTPKPTDLRNQESSQRI